MDRFEFTPSTGFKDASAFADPASETETREQLFLPHEQTQTYLNDTLVPAVETAQQNIQTLQSQVEALVGATGDPTAIQNILNAIASINDFLSVVDTVAYLE